MMAVYLEKKNGGPYTKDDQESRRNEVSRLHFEHGYSARKIAHIMKVNRNTINSDVRYLYNIIREETKEKRDDLFLEQIGRLEAQRNRIVEELLNGTSEKIKLEKLVLDIDGKINDILMKTNLVEKPEKQNNNLLIREIVLFLITKHAKSYGLTRNEIISEIINMQQCTIQEAKDIFSQMISLGLEYCTKAKGECLYDLIEFALMRKYTEINSKFLKEIQALWFLWHKMDSEIDSINANYQKKFGKKETWNDETFSKFDVEREGIRENSANTFASIISDISDEIDEFVSKERFLKLTQYMNVFFNKKESMLEQMINNTR